MERRRLLQSLALGSLAATPALTAEAARITVTNLEIFTVKVNRRGNWLLTRLGTSAGVQGIGEVVQVHFQIRSERGPSNRLDSNPPQISITAVRALWLRTGRGKKDLKNAAHSRTREKAVGRAQSQR